MRLSLLSTALLSVVVAGTSPAFAEVPAIDNATSSQADRVAIAARLERLQHLRVVYDIEYRTPPTPATLPAALPGKSNALQLSLPSGYRKRVTFTYFEGFARWDSEDLADAIEWKRRQKIVVATQAAETYDGATRQDLHVQAVGPIGGIISGDAKERWSVLEVGLGLRTKANGEWMTQSLLEKASIRSISDHEVELAYMSNDQQCAWFFDRAQGYAITRYQRSKGRTLETIIAGDFHDVEGVILPFSVRGSPFYDSAHQTARFMITATSYSFNVSKTPAIEFPKNTQLVDGRTGLHYTVREESHVVTDADLANASTSMADNRSALLLHVPATRSHSANSGPFMSMLSWLITALGAGLIAVVLYHYRRQLLAWCRHRVTST